MSQKPILELMQLEIGKARFSNSSIFDGLCPSKLAMHPCIAEAVAFCDTLPIRGWAARMTAVKPQDRFTASRGRKAGTA
ncbi:MAG: hypothetical protein AXA67_10695 [Methylothermaceae bacteria B42]|nr:MAG: hypothetical protein AXA67_10695 [Methylothermaceae bacteria B42]